ncbi:MFS transporter [Paenibacillus filicis]|uniref:MFS transporter n=1 Tax=Paenibacillus gyeongsangnamensis TaxID=3388067 RepID=A0ABT4QAY5_9BACL|nr:MFS transporter [Paenibacillus filicis]MCZ8514054.1 MFS transporter [Paenibacillus filicis]
MACGRLRARICRYGLGRRAALGRLDLKRVMVWGMLAFSVSTVLCGLADSFWSMLLFRAAAGISAAFVSPQVWAAIPALGKPQQIVKAMGVAMAGLSVSQLLGVLLGSFLAAVSWPVPFYCLGGLSLLLTMAIGLTVPPLNAQNRAAAGRTALADRYRSVLAVPSTARSFFAYFLFHTGSFGAFSFIGTFLSREHGLDLGGIGQTMIWLGAGNLAGSLTGGILVQRWGAARVFRGAFLTVFAVYLAVPAVQVLLGAQLLFTLCSFAGGVLFPLIMSTLQSLAPDSRGTIASLSNALMYAGAAVGSYAGGLLYAAFGRFAAVGWLAAGLFAAAFMLFSLGGLFAWRRPVQGKEAELA